VPFFFRCWTKRHRLLFPSTANQEALHQEKRGQSGTNLHRFSNLSSIGCIFLRALPFPPVAVVLCEFPLSARGPFTGCPPSQMSESAGICARVHARARGSRVPVEHQRNFAVGSVSLNLSRLHRCAYPPLPVIAIVRNFEALPTAHTYRCAQTRMEFRLEATIRSSDHARGSLLSLTFSSHRRLIQSFGARLIDEKYQTIANGIRTRNAYCTSNGSTRASV